MEADVSAGCLTTPQAKAVPFCIRQLTYRTHYSLKFPNSWDEWVPESRLLKLNDDNLAKQKALVEARRAGVTGPESSGKGAGAASASGAAGNAAGSSSRRSGGDRGASEAAEAEKSSRGSKKEPRGTKRGRETIEQVSTCRTLRYQLESLVERRTANTDTYL